jgi:hypothetical protein
LILSLNSPRYSNFCAFGVLSASVKFHSVYHPYKLILLCGLSAYRQFHSVYYLKMLNWSEIKHKICKFSACAKFHSWYSQYMLNFILIICVKIDSPFYQYTDNFHSAFISMAFCLKSSTHSAHYKYALNFIPCMISIH